MHEPGNVAALSAYQSLNMKGVFDKTAKHGRQRSSMVYVLPQLWYNRDVDFEGGRWKSFPEVPELTKWFLINVVGCWKYNWWHFGSSGADGRQRPLLALSGGYGR